MSCRSWLSGRLGSGWSLKIFLRVLSPRSVFMFVYKLSMSSVNKWQDEGTAMGRMMSRKW